MTSIPTIRSFDPDFAALEQRVGELRAALNAANDEARATESALMAPRADREANLDAAARALVAGEAVEPSVDLAALSISLEAANRRIVALRRAVEIVDQDLDHARANASLRLRETMDASWRVIAAAMVRAAVDLAEAHLRVDAFLRDIAEKGFKADYAFATSAHPRMFASPAAPNSAVHAFISAWAADAAVSSLPEWHRK